ncbi:microfibrillar-associated protein 1 [Chrysoperla carnea]|uniref:microfibrillar-associated protein 1 n=1 Tax=Chrysoperla carnea TaxID=189513 RepID=UPI001D067B82|nr:microfibrillar-associated protein 1 [Chrysoperla carnea]
MMNPQSVFGIQSTAGAIPVRNEKGEVSMQKVKVHRYVSGKRPDYAPYESSESESGEDDFIERRNRRSHRDPDREQPELSKMDEREGDEMDDPRLRRLKSRPVEEDLDIEHRAHRHRHIHEPEVLETSEEEEQVEEEPQEVERIRPRHTVECSDDSESEGDLSDEEIERRRQLLRQRVLNKKQEEEILAKEDDGKSEEESSESSEYEEYSDSEEETGPRLKPVFVRKRDRITIIEKEKEELKRKQSEIEAKKMADERKRQTLRMVEEVIRKEQQAKTEDNEPNLNDICTDDENDEVEYEAWKLRELKRIKRDREEREQLERERLEIDRLRNMTEEERRLEMRLNPKQITNKAAKGKYKFLQKYYHRGAFYLDNDSDIYKRDFSSATLEDHFDKTILPKVMQVKNFGRSGRTKYTHLVDQDTTHFDSPWVNESSQNLKFHNSQAAGMKQVFDKPSLKKKREH